MSPINMSVIRRHQNLQARRSKLKSAGPLMQRTIKKYERDAARIRTRLGSMPKDQPLRKRLMIAFTENASRPSYARQLRAAMRYSIIVRLDENILKAWAAIEAGDALTAIRALEKGEHGCSWAETIERMIAEDDWNLPNPKPRRSKAAVLAQLPAGWRETLLGHLKGKEHRFWQAVGVMACSGCRPEEVRLQVEIKTLDAGAVGGLNRSSQQPFDRRLRWPKGSVDQPDLDARLYFPLDAPVLPAVKIAGASGV